MAADVCCRYRYSRHTLLAGSHGASTFIHSSICWSNLTATVGAATAVIVWGGVRQVSDEPHFVRCCVAALHHTWDTPSPPHSHIDMCRAATSIIVSASESNLRSCLCSLTFSFVMMPWMERKPYAEAKRRATLPSTCR